MAAIYRRGRWVNTLKPEQIDQSFADDNIKDTFGIGLFVFD